MPRPPCARRPCCATTAPGPKGWPRWSRPRAPTGAAPSTGGTPGTCAGRDGPPALPRRCWPLPPAGRRRPSNGWRRACASEPRSWTWPLTRRTWSPTCPAVRCCRPPPTTPRAWCASCWRPSAIRPASPRRSSRRPPRAHVCACWRRRAGSCRRAPTTRRMTWVQGAIARAASQPIPNLLLRRVVGMVEDPLVQASVLGELIAANPAPTTCASWSSAGPKRWSGPASAKRRPPPTASYSRARSLAMPTWPCGGCYGRCATATASTDSGTTNTNPIAMRDVGGLPPPHWSSGPASPATCAAIPPRRRPS